MPVRTISLAGALVLAFVTCAAAQGWPQRAIRIIVPFGPAGGSDIVSRIIAPRLQEKLGQSVIIENRPGAGGILGNEVIAHADKDGYTIGIMTAGQIIAAVVSKSVPYDPHTAFDPIAEVGTTALVICTRPDYPADNVTDLIAAAKANPGKVKFGSPSFAATQHLAGEMFKQIAGVDMVAIPYRSSPETVTAMLGKQVDVIFDTASAVMGAVQSGQIKPLAVTSKDRFPALPHVPAAVESGLLPGYDVTSWYGFFAPHGTPSSIIAKLNRAFNDTIARGGVDAELATAGIVVKGSTPEEFGDFMEHEFVRWEKVRIAAGIPRQ